MKGFTSSVSLDDFVNGEKRWKWIECGYRWDGEKWAWYKEERGVSDDSLEEH